MTLVLALLLVIVLPISSAEYVEVIPLRYDNASSFSEGLAAVAIGEWTRNEYDTGGFYFTFSGKWGYIDTAGNEVLPFVYDYAGAFVNGAAYVRHGGRDYYIDKTGAAVTPPYTPYPSPALRPVWNGGLQKYGYIDLNGNEVVTYIYDYARAFSEGLAAVMYIDDWVIGWGFINETGEVAIPLVYSSAESFSEGLAAVQNFVLDGSRDVKKWGFIDLNGRETAPLKYEEVEMFSEGFAAVATGGMTHYDTYSRYEQLKWGFIDASGREVVPPQYFSVHSMSEGLAAVATGRWVDGKWEAKWGFISLTGTSTPPPSPPPPSPPPPPADISVLLNGQLLEFVQPPVLIDGRTLVPLRAIFEAMGANIDWDDETLTVTSVRDDITVTLQIGSNVLVRNGEEIPLDVPAQLVNGRTMVPARAVAESFGAEVGWDGSTHTVIITE